MNDDHQSDAGILSSWATNDPLLDAVDWAVVYAFLVAVACEKLRHCGPDDVVCGLGETPRDFAWGTCLQMLNHGLKWPPSYALSTPAMCGFLRKVMSHDIVDRIRVRKGKGRVKLDFEQAAEPGFSPASEGTNPLLLMMTREGDGTVARFFEDFRVHPDPHPKFPTYVRLILSNPLLPPRKAAAILGVPVREVNEMRRRLIRRIRRFWSEEALEGRPHSPHRRKRSQPS